MKITKDIFYIGVNDHNVDLFEGQYPVPNGMAYNSYVILDNQIAVMDTVDKHFFKEWISNLENVLEDRSPDFLIVQHMEPDHSACIKQFMELYPNAKIVASAKAFSMMNNFFGTDFSERQLIVGEGDTLELGTHILNFVTAPMVHWPEVIVTYDSTDNVLFSADAFGKFGALDVEEDWDAEARRYYFGIVGKYGAQVQKLLAKASALDIQIICALHGPILKDNLDHYLNLYQLWSSYEPEEDGILIAYASMYGNTKNAAELLGENLKNSGCSNVTLIDLARNDITKAVEDAFHYDRLVLAAPTYNTDVFPIMRTFIQYLIDRNFQKHTVAFIENGSWAPLSAKVMKSMLENCKNITFAETTVTIKSALNTTSITQIETLAAELTNNGSK